MLGPQRTKQCWSAALIGWHSLDAWHSSLFVIVPIRLSKHTVSIKRLVEVFTDTLLIRGRRRGSIGLPAVVAVAPSRAATRGRVSRTIALVGRKKPRQGEFRPNIDSGRSDGLLEPGSARVGTMMRRRALSVGVVVACVLQAVPLASQPNIQLVAAKQSVAQFYSGK